MSSSVWGSGKDVLMNLAAVNCPYGAFPLVMVRQAIYIRVAEAISVLCVLNCACIGQGL